ncbi:MAG TPA: hypothetical protein VF192_16840 [Longimicrobiales bacterium]
MSPAAHGTIGFRASPRLYRGKVLLFALSIAVVSLAEALQTNAREEAARPAGTEVSERVVLDEADAIFAPEATAPAAAEAVCREVPGPFARPLPAPCDTCRCNTRPQRFAPHAS